MKENSHLTILTILTCLIFLNINSSIAQSKLSTEVGLWNNDISFLKEQSLKTIPDLKQHPKYDEYFKKLDSLIQIKQLNSSDSIVFQLQKALNLIGDDGCNIIPFQTVLNLDLLPVKAYWFNDGLFVVASKSKSLIGEQIEEINGIKIETLFKMLKPYLNADNIHYQKKRFPIYAFMPRLLKAIHAGESETEIEIKFSSGMKSILQAESILEFIKLNRISDRSHKFSIANSKDLNYWKSIKKEDSIMFIQLRKIEDDKTTNSFKSFTNEIENDLVKHGIKKVILDLRFGGTGNGFKLSPLVSLLKESESINKNGALLVLLGGSTKGPLAELASMLEQNTKAVFIGEPTAEGPNSVSDTKYITLENNGLGISLTSKYWPTSWSFDTRNTLEPTVKIEFNYEDYLQNIDPWIEAALSYKPLEQGTRVTEEIVKQIIGTYSVDSEKLTIQEKGNHVYMSKKKKLGTFFELESELFHFKNGVLSSDINNVYINYELDLSHKLKSLQLEWKGKKVELVK